MVYVNRELVTARYFPLVSVKEKRWWPRSPRPTITAATRRPPLINSFESDKNIVLVYFSTREQVTEVIYARRLVSRRKMRFSTAYLPRPSPVVHQTVFTRPFASA